MLCRPAVKHLLNYYNKRCAIQHDSPSNVCYIGNSNVLLLELPDCLVLLLAERRHTMWFHKNYLLVIAWVAHVQIRHDFWGLEALRLLKSCQNLRNVIQKSRGGTRKVGQKYFSAGEQLSKFLYSWNISWTCILCWRET